MNENKREYVKRVTWPYSCDAKIQATISLDVQWYNVYFITHFWWILQNFSSSRIPFLCNVVIQFVDQIYFFNRHFILLAMPKWNTFHHHTHEYQLEKFTALLAFQINQYISIRCFISNLIRYWSPHDQVNSFYWNSNHIAKLKNLTMAIQRGWNW